MRPDEIAKSVVGEMRDDLEKGGGRVHVGEYTRVDPRSGKVVHVSSYDRSVVAKLTEALSSVGEGESVDLPNGLGRIRRNSGDSETAGVKGGYSAIAANGHGVGTYPRVTEAVDAIAHSNGGGQFSRFAGKLNSSPNRLHPKEQTTPGPKEKRRWFRR